MGSSDIVFAPAFKCFPGETVCGDAWTMESTKQGTRLSVIDGLGHGPEAAEAARVAVEILQAKPELPPTEALAACHSAMRHTRGAAMLTVLIDVAHNLLHYAGAGNVEGRLTGPGGERHLVSFRGIVGHALPTPRAFTLELPDVWTLIVHTDGINSRFEIAGAQTEDPQQLATRLLRECGRTTDDATVVVAVRGVS